MSPQIKRYIRKIDEDNVEVTLEVLIGEIDNKQPFSLNASICGIFYLEKWSERIDFIKYNTIAILFPYLRSFVTIVTSNSNLPPYIIPVMNTFTLFKNSENNNE